MINVLRSPHRLHRRRLSQLGLKLPSRSQVIAEADRITEEQIDKLLFRQSENERLKQGYVQRLHDAAAKAANGQANVAVLASRKTVEEGYTQQEVNESEQRRIDRAVRLAQSAVNSNDPRAKRVFVVRDDVNIQRERQLANGTTEVAISTAEAKELAEKVDKAITESGGDALKAAEGLIVSREVVAMAGELVDGLGGVAISTNAENTLRFGEQVQKFLEANGDAVTQRIGHALLNAIKSTPDTREAAQALSAFQWMEESDATTQSYYVSRPLQVRGINRVVSHNFIVTNAGYLGDPNATVFSFGHNDSGKLGMVDDCTSNEFSSTTHSEDYKAWIALAYPSSEEAKRIDYVLIPVASNKIREAALSVMEDDDYAMFSGVFGINSNSAAHAIANHFSKVSDPSWRLSLGSGNADKINFGLYVRENGCGSGLYYEKELDSTPMF